MVRVFVLGYNLPRLFTGQQIKNMHYEGVVKLMSGLQQHTSQAEINKLASRLRKGLKPNEERIKLSSL